MSVSGKLPPTVVKPAPAIEAALTITGDVPDDVSVTDRAVEVFTVTLPKSRLVVLTVNCAFAAIPVPLNATAAVLPLAELLLIVSCPVAAPVVVGRNCTCRVMDWLGLSETGKLPATKVKPAPAIEAEFTVTAEVPDEVSVTEAVAAEFTVTVPKLRAEALNVNCGCRCRPGFAKAMLADDAKARLQASARRRSLPRLRSRRIPASKEEHEAIISGD